MSLYTKRGDAGETSLYGGGRVAKDSARVEAYGSLDEACCAIGYARVVCRDDLVCGVLRFAQHKSMVCSAMLAVVGEARASLPRVTEEDVVVLERCSDALEARYEQPGLFVIEGSCEAAARLNVARAVTRRSERRIVSLAAQETVDPAVMAFVNRLSDVLYACSCAERSSCGFEAEPWNPDTVAPEL